jgi:hypothetical protein
METLLNDLSALLTNVTSLIPCLQDGDAALKDVHEHARRMKHKAYQVGSRNDAMAQKLSTIAPLRRCAIHDAS